MYSEFHVEQRGPVYCPRCKDTVGLYRRLPTGPLSWWGRLRARFRPWLCGRCDLPRPDVSMKADGLQLGWLQRRQEPRPRLYRPPGEPGEPGSERARGDRMRGREPGRGVLTRGQAEDPGEGYFVPCLVLWAVFAFGSKGEPARSFSNFSANRAISWNSREGPR
jgi:hypothetical protein